MPFVTSRVKARSLLGSAAPSAGSKVASNAGSSACPIGAEVANVSDSEGRLFLRGWPERISTIIERCCSNWSSSSWCCAKLREHDKQKEVKKTGLHASRPVPMGVYQCKKCYSHYSHCWNMLRSNPCSEHSIACSQIYDGIHWNCNATGQLTSICVIVVQTNFDAHCRTSGVSCIFITDFTLQRPQLAQNIPEPEAHLDFSHQLFCGVLPGKFCFWQAAHPLTRII